MSDNMNPNTNPNPNADANQGNGNGKQSTNQPPNGDNIIVAGFKLAKQKVSDGWAAVKQHPVTHFLAALTGTVGGGYVVYKVMDATRPAIPETQSVPMMPEPEKKEEEEQTTGNPVEYVDIPQVPTTTEE